MSYPFQENTEMVSSLKSYGYILNRRPFRENSLLLDIFTEDFGRICCVARPAKKRGKILKGNLEPFRYLFLQWTGKGDVQTLTEADERGRHTIPPSEMMLGLYLNELILLLTRQHVSIPELFSAYKYTLHKMGDTTINRHIMMRFEVYLLACLGYSLDLDNHEISQTKEAISKEIRYCFSLDSGLTSISQDTIKDASTIEVTSDLLLALQDIQNMQESHWKQLRHFLDRVFILLAPRTINSRKLLVL